MKTLYIHITGTRSKRFNTLPRIDKESRSGCLIPELPLYLYLI